MADDNNQGPIPSMTAEDDEGPILNWNLRRKKSGPKKKRVPNTTEQFFKVSEILEETRKFYPILDNEDIAKSFNEFTDAMFKMHGVGETIYKNRVNIHVLFAKFERLGVPKLDENSQTDWTINAKNGRTFHVRSGHVSMDPEVLKVVGKATVWKRGSKDDAYNFALLALDDKSFHPPHKIRLNNLDREFQLKVQTALAQLSKECLPPGVSFIVANPVIGVSPRMKFEDILHCSKDEIHDMEEVEEKVKQGSDRQQKADRRTRPAKPITPQKPIVEEATNTEAEEISALKMADIMEDIDREFYREVKPEEAQYNKIKNLILTHPFDFIGDDVESLTQHLVKALPEESLTPEMVTKIWNHLEYDKVINIDETAPGKIKSVMSTPLKSDDADYNKILASMLHGIPSWGGKHRKDVGEFLFGTGPLKEDQEKALRKIWVSLKANGVIKLGKGSVIEPISTVFAGTDIGAEIIRAAKVSKPSPTAATPAEPKPEPKGPPLSEILRDSVDNIALDLFNRVKSAFDRAKANRAGVAARVEPVPEPVAPVPDPVSTTTAHASTSDTGAEDGQDGPPAPIKTGIAADMAEAASYVNSDEETSPSAEDLDAAIRAKRAGNGAANGGPTAGTTP